MRKIVPTFSVATLAFVKTAFVFTHMTIIRIALLKHHETEYIYLSVELHACSRLTITKDKKSVNKCRATKAT